MSRSFGQRIWNAARSLKQPSSEINSKLLQAVLANDANRVVKYLNRGADVNTRDIDDDNNTVLMISVKKGQYNIGKLLLKKKPKLDLYNSRRDDVFDIIKRVIFYDMQYNPINFKEGVEFFRLLVSKLPVGDKHTKLIDLHHFEHELREKELQKALRENPNNQAAIRIRFAGLEIEARRRDARENVADGMDSDFTEREALRIRADAGNRNAIDELDRERQRERVFAQQRANPTFTHEQAERAAQAAPVDAFHVHREAGKFQEKLPIIINIIKKDLGTAKDYSDIIEFFDSTIGDYIRTSPVFEKKNANAKKNIKRDVWIKDYNTIKDRLGGSSPNIKIQIGSIIDFIFKHELQDCFIVGFVYDAAHAYEGNTCHEELSCYGGIIERVTSTFINCIKGLEGDVFDDLYEIIADDITTWDALSKDKQVAYTMKWNNFIMEWAQQKLSNNDVSSFTEEERSNAVMRDFKEREGIPTYVEDHIRSELFPIPWEDYGFNASGGGKTRKSKRKNKRTLRKRHTVPRIRK
jgi:hypothetical protein